MRWLVLATLALVLGLEAVLAPERAASRQGSIARWLGAEPGESSSFAPVRMRAIGWLLLGLAVVFAGMWWRDPG